MAKLLLLLDTDHLASVEALLIERASVLFGNEANLTLQLMREVPGDVFYDPGSAHARPPLVVELVTSPGRPLAGLTNCLLDFLSDAPVAPTSQVFVMQERIFIPCAPQSVYYHYLMVRSPQFSAADYNDYYSNYHCRFGFHTPEIEGYSQNYIDAVASQALALQLGLRTRDVTSISELKMPSMDAFLASPAMAELGPPAAEDESRFVDRADSVSFCSEVILRLGDFDTVGEAVFEQHFSA